MNGSFEDLNITTLIILVVAVVIFLRLRSVLGRRTGHERPPIDHSAGRAEDTTAYEQDNVVHLPTGRDNQVETKAGDDPEVIQKKIKGFASEDSDLAKNLTKMIKKDPDFDPKSFLEGAKAAYEMIVTAFNDGDKAALKPLLSSDVYESFTDELIARDDREEVNEASFIGIDKAVLLDVETNGSEASITIKFVSKLISAVRNKAGEVISGDPKKIIEVTDIWTFARNVTSKDPNWKLVGTESAN